MGEFKPHERLERWLAEYRKSRHHNQYSVHAFHVGDEREAELTPADIEEVLAQRADLLGSLKFILAFYEPGQTCLDTNAWKQAEASARAAVARATGSEAK